MFLDTIIVCTVTGSTHAGMIAGFAALEDLTGVQRRVLGIDASATLAKTRDQVARIARHTAALIELGRELRDDEITMLDGWTGELYGTRHPGFVPATETDVRHRSSGSKRQIRWQTRVDGGWPGWGDDDGDGPRASGRR